jgi:hypothetical protein
MLSLQKLSAPVYTVDNSLKLMSTNGQVISFNIPANSATNLVDFIQIIKSNTSEILLLSDSELLFIGNEEISAANESQVIIPLPTINFESNYVVANYSVKERYVWGVGGLLLGKLF